MHLWRLTRHCQQYFTKTVFHKRFIQVHKENQEQPGLLPTGFTPANFPVMLLWTLVFVKISRAIRKMRKKSSGATTAYFFIHSCNISSNYTRVHWRLYTCGYLSRCCIYSTQLKCNHIWAELPIIIDYNWIVSDPRSSFVHNFATALVLNHFTNSTPAL